jgi:hypothetical protein
MVSRYAPNAKKVTSKVYTILLRPSMSTFSVSLYLDDLHEYTFRGLNIRRASMQMFSIKTGKEDACMDDVGYDCILIQTQTRRTG